MTQLIHPYLKDSTCIVMILDHYSIFMLKSNQYRKGVAGPIAKLDGRTARRIPQFGTFHFRTLLGRPTERSL
jgi:hypothetical protein